MATPNDVLRVRPLARHGNRVPTVPACERGPYTTSTPSAPFLRVAGDGYGFTTDPARARGSDRDAERRCALEADRTRALELFTFHCRKGDVASWTKASQRVGHVDMLIRQGEVEGRWES